MMTHYFLKRVLRAYAFNYGFIFCFNVFDENR